MINHQDILKLVLTLQLASACSFVAVEAYRPESGPKAQQKELISFLSFFQIFLQGNLYLN